MPNLGRSFDLILCDLPYGTTACKWDVILPFDRLWKCYWKLLKPTGTILLTATQPFAALVVASAIDHFKYELIWRKTKAIGFWTIAWDRARPELRAPEPGVGSSG